MKSKSDIWDIFIMVLFFLGGLIKCLLFLLTDLIWGITRRIVIYSYALTLSFKKLWALRGLAVKRRLLQKYLDSPPAATLEQGAKIDRLEVLYWKNFSKCQDLGVKAWRLKLFSLPNEDEDD